MLRAVPFTDSIADWIEKQLRSGIARGELRGEDRYQTRSTILTSQPPVTRWHDQIGDPTAADGILEPLVHNAHRIDMRGESMRKERSTKPTG